MTCTEAWAKLVQAVHAEDPEEVCTALAEWFETNASHETDPGVITCLQSAAEHARYAGLDYYVSTK